MLTSGVRPDTHLTIPIIFCSATFIQLAGTHSCGVSDNLSLPMKKCSSITVHCVAVAANTSLATVYTELALGSRVQLGQDCGCGREGRRGRGVGVVEGS